MSQQTAKLMGRPHRSSSKWPDVLEEVADRLVSKYGTPSLGNYRDPVKEVFYILLSARTTEALYKRAHRSLFLTFPGIENLADAGVEEVLGCIDGAGLGRKRSVQIIQLAKTLVNDFGRNPAKRLRAMSAYEAYNYLTALPGLGPKSALCVMMYSLDLDVFPVDVNVQRVAERMGIIPHKLKHYQAQQRLPKLVPSGRSKELHIGLVILGRRACLPIRPKCDECVVADLCRTGQKETRVR